MFINSNIFAQHSALSAPTGGTPLEDNVIQPGSVVTVTRVFRHRPCYISGQKDLQFANQRGNRELNSLFYVLAVRVTSPVGYNSKIINQFFYDYFHHKQLEGKTKRQALKCVERRLINIIWTMLTNNEEYVNPPVFDKPKDEE